MNLSFRTRRFLQGLGIFLIVLVLLAVVAWLIWLIWLDRFVVYTRDGVKIDFSLSSQQLSGEVAKPPEENHTIDIYFNEGENEMVTSTELEKLTGYYADVTSLEREFDLVLQQVSLLPPEAPVMLDVKDIRGNFLYTTSVGNYQSSAVSASQMDSLIAHLRSPGAYMIARLPAFKDYRYGLDNVPYGLHHSSNRYLYMDEDRCYWLDPNSEGTMSYLMRIVSELKGLGFDEVVFDYFWYPDTKDLAYKGDREASIANAAQRLVENCATETFAISFVGLEPDFTLPEGRSRLYLTNRSASNAATLAKETQIEEDIEIKLVFVTDVNDTRFDAYGALRPITAARLDEEAE